MALNAINIGATFKVVFVLVVSDALKMESPPLSTLYRKNKGKLWDTLEIRFFLHFFFDWYLF